ncbi:hypothetical protein N0V93_008939 [Gnomoniopsis smithogilvyi]|uniref:Uncharacterized protein n=1 Tax=Gnomoniopsis smithogilvyi TaxID=1191159 RepID=A0A9W8YM56_9PEZI|nr:hypothetical protein N0V93_008939 [Gnomoniopsis smithogilvyi]
MDLACPIKPSQPTDILTLATIDACGEVMLWIMLIYLMLLALAIPPVLALFGLVAALFKRPWILLRKVIWKGVISYISWVTRISVFLIFGPDVKYAVLLVLVVFWGIVPTAVLILVLLTAPLGQVLLNAYLCTGVLLLLSHLLVEYMMALWQENVNVLVALVMGTVTIIWQVRQIWEWYYLCGSGAAYLADAEEQWEDEDRIWVIIRDEFEERAQEWLVEGRQWWENLFWRHHLW